MARGRFVSLAEAAARGHYAELPPEQRLLSSTALAIVCVLMGLYALCGMVFGYLLVFMPGGFLPLQGVPAVLGSVGSAALGFGWATHLVQRHWSTASERGCATVRRAAYRVSGVSWVLAMLAALVILAADIHWLARPLTVGPQAEWLLAPLPWLWRYTVAFARDDVVIRIYVVGTIGVLGFLLFHKGLRWPRGEMACIGLLSWTVGLYFVGDGAYLYAAARGLGGLQAPHLTAAWGTAPGLHNAWTWLAWWGGLTGVAAGTLSLWASVFLPPKAVARM